MRTLLQQIENRMRGLVLRAKPHQIHDTAETQTVDAVIANGVHRNDIEVMQPFGFSSHAPAGSLMLVFAVGGDQGDLVALPVSAPSSRAGNLDAGESMLYGTSGQRVHCLADGSIDIQSAVKLHLKAPQFVLECDGVTVTISGAGVAITGGVVTHNGTNIGSDHVHGGISPGPANTAGPH